VNILYYSSGGATPAEKRQLQAVVVGQNVLHKKISEGDLSEEILGKVDSMVTAIFNKNFAAANTIQMVSV
jgi:hypothetical protein